MVPGREEMGPGCDEMGPGCDEMGPGCDEMGPGCDEMGPGREDMGPRREETGPGREDTGPGREKMGPGREEMGLGLEEISRKKNRPSESPPPPPPVVQQTTKASKNTVRTEVFVGHAVRYPINSIPKPGPYFIRALRKKIRSEMEVFVGQGIRCTRGGGGGILILRGCCLCHAHKHDHKKGLAALEAGAVGCLSAGSTAGRGWPGLVVHYGTEVLPHAKKPSLKQ